MAKEYKDTLNLPVTEYSMRANLTVKEPEILARWNEMGLYDLMLAVNEGNDEFILHDGPPFSNGNIHIGHALNKLLKDFIVKSKSMQGYRTPFVPGWDNHGMPIESAIIKKNKLDRKRMTVPEFRQNCQEFAQNFIDLQRESFKRLGVVGDWQNPYITMAPEFEATEIKIFGEMYSKGYIYKGLKPVYWCAHDETALAEAEIEYADDKCTSIYVKFAVNDDKGVLDGLCDKSKTYFIIWTTTPWTLPGNMAIALHPREKYVLVKAGEEYYILADALCQKTMNFGGISEYEVIAEFKGGEFEYCTASHPFLGKTSLLVTADYVTMDSGTGCVHTAPGFGVDDYHTGMRYGLDICVPVDDRGRQTELAGKYQGMTTDESNKAIVDDMRESGALFASEELVHSYPHCWRCKHPIIFRATPQWFCSVEKFRDDAVKACEGVEWIPAWGGDRIASMIKERADWCISRQRHWGLPIPVFYCEDCGEVICNSETINSVADIFSREGSNAWFIREAGELLPEGFVCPKCGKTHFAKETDTLDGWFDSGSSHYSVLGDKVADLYLEGADQYRGWFQSSLLTSIGGHKGKAPFKQVLTHGWTVDGEGKAMHKSLGNTVAPEQVITRYGADMLRLWVASSDYRADVRVSDAIFKQLSESYRKIRNTIRILLANVGDFDPDRDAVGREDMSPIDRWALASLGRLVKKCTKAYNDYEFHVVYHETLSFCTIELSKWYIDMTKDTLYCEKSDAKERRAVQTVMYEALSAIIRLIAPVLSYTAEEAWSFLKHRNGDDERSVFLNRLPEYTSADGDDELCDEYDRLFTCRDDVMKALEVARAEKLIGKSLEAEVTVYGDCEAIDLFERHRAQLETVFIVSKVHVVRGEIPENVFKDTACGIGVGVKLASGEKCVRCWAYRDDTVDGGEGGRLCRRCHDAVC